MARDEFFADAKGVLERRVGMRCSRSLPQFPIDRRRAARSATSGSAGAADGTTRNAAAWLLTLVELGTSGTASLRATLARRECFALFGVAMTEHLPPPSYSNSRGGAVSHYRWHRGSALHRQPEFLDRAGRVAAVLAAVTRVVFVVNLLAAGVIPFLLFPGFTVSAARTVGREPGKSLGAGAGVLGGTALMVALLLTSAVGLPLGLALIAFLGLALLLGFLTFAVFLGEAGVRLAGRSPDLSPGWRILTLAGGVTVLALIRFIAVLGNLTLLVALVAGLGAWSLHAWRTYRSGEGEGPSQG